jgi:hypothetical protein
MAKPKWVAMVATIAVVAPLGAAGGPPAGGAEPAPFTLTAAPTHGLPGDQVVVSATACVPPGAEARLVFEGFTGSGAGLEADVRTVTADGSGSFTTSFTVPYVVHETETSGFGGLVSTGEYAIEAVPVSEGVLAPCRAQFHVDGPGLLPLSVSPTSGPAGSAVEVSGVCFAPVASNVRLHGEVDGQPLPDSEVAGVEPTGPADPTTLEEWTGSFQVPAGLPDGTVVSLVGACSTLGFAPATVVVVTKVASNPADATGAAAVTATPALTG